MTQEEKILVADLCSRLPYSIKVRFNNNPNSIRIITSIRKFDEELWECTFDGHSGWYGIDKTLKPFLRKLSSMRLDEAMTYNSLIKFGKMYGVDWLLKHHFDYRGLIDKGLALEMPEEMYDK